MLFASSVLNLAELIALRPDLLPVKKYLYFHEVISNNYYRNST